MTDLDASAESYKLLANDNQPNQDLSAPLVHHAPNGTSSAHLRPGYPRPTNPARAQPQSGFQQRSHPLNLTQSTADQISEIGGRIVSKIWHGILYVTRATINKYSEWVGPYSAQSHSYSGLSMHEPGSDQDSKRGVHRSRGAAGRDQGCFSCCGRRFSRIMCFFILIGLTILSIVITSDILGSDYFVEERRLVWVRYFTHDEPVKIILAKHNLYIRCRQDQYQTQAMCNL